MASRAVGLAVGASLRQKLPLSTCPSFLHRAHLSSVSSEHLPRGFRIWPTYFSVNEQRILLRASLSKLDNSESIRSRKRRRSYLKTSSANLSEPTDVRDIFLPDEYYEFQEGHYDGVIRDYREMHLASWPVDEFVGLTSVLKRLYDLCPSQDVQTHLLHLASRGCILPHTDNIDASGSWILGVSIGDQRLLRLESVGDTTAFEVLLPSGSVYLQSGDIRYTYKHSITRISEDDSGQRLSIIVRDLPLATTKP
ncbi:hypothetical protein NP233_g8397 [Leucocoprinus birnbaumii]|uniref:Alpha-ketoglutarate-dependent dioxygenase AlkB-like domain-containing protein n=1 Tax=Leucocoprinus birnbaumii TaxID=56174 RepID=A0AAD5VSW4_9AGAR|nr:hypothetical protein NP233_g8397 [Leucocoprinus birnbaumii]